MGTLHSIYVRTDDTDAVLDALKKDAAKEIRVQSEPGKSFLEVAWHDFDAPQESLKRLSVHLRTDVLWLVFQSAVETFEFAHWRSGECVRHLVYGCREERTWEWVDGEMEPWESNEFELAGPGEFEPSLDARETARDVAEHYGLPGWEL